jgi:protein subunit release factor B
MIRVTKRIAIDAGEIAESRVHAGEPGGQNVNKLTSRSICASVPHAGARRQDA